MSQKVKYNSYKIGIASTNIDSAIEQALSIAREILKLNVAKVEIYPTVYIESKRQGINPDKVIIDDLIKYPKKFKNQNIKKAGEK